MSKGPKKNKGPKPAKGDSKKSFNEAALSNLTAKLDQNLSNASTKAQSQSQSHSQAHSQKRKTPPTKDTGKDQQQKKQRKSQGPENGAPKPGVDQAALLAEIKALGGDEEDLALINGIDSDDEDYGSKGGSSDKKLQDEVAKMAKELGFAEIVPQEPSEDEEDEGADEPEEEASEDEDEDEDDGQGDGKSGDTMRKVEGMVRSDPIIIQTAH